MELTTPNDDIQIKLPVPHIIKQALLLLDYSQGVMPNQVAANLLAEQFCLS